jgi:hypothetical protein
MATERDKPVDRDAWRRLLDGGDDAPPALTDARIRAAARRALAPRTARTQRWWLPASLAATLLLAVLVVQWQYGERGTPAVVTESDVAAPSPAQRAPHSPQARSRDKTTTPEVASPKIEPPEPGSRTRREAADEDRNATEAAARFGEAAPATQAAPPSARAAVPAPAVAAESARESRAKQEAGLWDGQQRSAEPMPSPEDWYAAIEELRAAGRYEDANRELEKLEAAYPGWLEKNHPRDR